MKRIISIVLVLMIFCGCCCADEGAEPDDLLQRFFDVIFSGRTQKAAANRRHAEVVAELRDMGIEVPDEAVERTEAWMVSLQEEMRKMGYEYEESPYDFAANLLMDLGMGEYDNDTGIWTPTSSTVYAFDTEVFDIEHMYRLFLRGVAAIVPGFEPADIRESIEENDETDTVFGIWGKSTVSFVLNGNHYERELLFMGDWFDDGAVRWINEVLAQEGFAHRLYEFYDWGQGLILLYGDDTVWERMCRLIPQA